MSRKDRVSIEFTDLSIDSTLKVTKFLYDFLVDDWLDLNDFDKKINKYTLLEQYFICVYGQEFYSKHRLKKWLNQTENNRFEPEMIELLYENAENFNFGVKGMTDSLRRILADKKLKGQDPEKIVLSFNEKPFEIRLPLYFPPLLENNLKTSKSYADDIKGFGEYIQTLFQDFFSDEDIHYFLYNSFKFKKNLYPIRLLYIEVDKITEFKSKMIELYTFYKGFYDAKKKRYQDYYEQYIKDVISGKETIKLTDVYGNIIDTEKPILSTNAGESRKKYFNGLKKKIKLPEITKYDFAKILYNSFPHIREDYIKKLIDEPNYKLEKFIEKTAHKIRN